MTQDVPSSKMLFTLIRFILTTVKIRKSYFFFLFRNKSKRIPYIFNTRSVKAVNLTAADF
jgi:hypothetical protein